LLCLGKLACTQLKHFRADPKLSAQQLPIHQVDANKVAEVLPTHEVDVHSTCRINNSDYCTCGHCKPMKSAKESICCKERKIGVHIMAGIQ
jgi:hypothetical protein